MGLATKISELLTREAARPERRGFWGALLRLAAPGLAGVKIALAAITLLEAMAASGLLGETAAGVSALLAAQIGRGLASPATTATALALIVILDDGGKRAMSIAQKALQFAIRPLLNERHRTGFAQGRVDGWVEGRIEGQVEGRVEGKVEGRAETQHEWETWLRRQQNAGATWPPTDPPPGSAPSA